MDRVLGAVTMSALGVCNVALACVFISQYLAVQRFLASRLEPAGGVWPRARAHGPTLMRKSPPPCRPRRAHARTHSRAPLTRLCMCVHVRACACLYACAGVPE